MLLKSNEGEEIASREQHRELAARIVSSSEFRRAPRQREFLLYVVEHKLAGNPDDVTETLIGHKVYGRSPAYDTGNDSIVRTEARTLRKRLGRYFATEGIGEPVILEIPRGGYLPVFRPRQQEAAAAGPSTRRQWLWFGAAATASAGVLLGVRPWTKVGFETPDEKLAAVPGKVHLESSDPELNQIFAHAKQRAMGCVYSGDPVGDWYATRPDAGSNVFCMRDVAHQSDGASVLGLARHTANMLRRFARSVSRSRDWCGYWIITKDGFAAPSAYTSDSDFGYCLPASFHLLRVCHNQFLWTGDPGYQSADFLNFYDHTAKDYPAIWDQDHDGIMENFRRPRVHASYNQQPPHFATAADLVGAQYAGYLAYAAIQDSIGRQGSLSQRLAREFRDKAAQLRQHFNTAWWNADQHRFYSGKLASGAFGTEVEAESNLYSLLFGIPEPGIKTEAALDTLERERPRFPGAYSYMPEVLFRHQRNARAYAMLPEIAAPEFFGKEIGEVSFAVVGAVANGLMGLSADAPRSTVATFPRLPATLEWAKLSHVPVLRNEITVEHRTLNETVLTNASGPAILWKACFPVGAAAGRDASRRFLLVDGAPTEATLEQGPDGRPLLAVTVSVVRGQSRSVHHSARAI